MAKRGRALTRGELKEQEVVRNACIAYTGYPSFAPDAKKVGKATRPGLVQGAVSAVSGLLKPVFGS